MAECLIWGLYQVYGNLWPKIAITWWLQIHEGFATLHKVFGITTKINLFWLKTLLLHLIMYFQDGSLCWSPFGAPWWEEFWERHYLWKSVNPSVFYKLRHVRFEQFLAIEFKQIDRFLNGVSPRRTKSVFKNKALSWKYTSLIKNFLRDNCFSYSIIVAKPFRFQSLPCKTALDV